ncbi:MAG: HAD family hydrolase [Gemmatimonadales bacterium]
MPTNGRKKLVLFDIDGTLLWTHGAGRRAIRRALLDELGTTGPIDGFRFDGKTDPQIVHELMDAADHPETGNQRLVDTICDRYADLLAQELHGDSVQVDVLPGVPELLDELEGRSDVLLGLLTGNVERGAALKLRSGGIDPARFKVGAFGSDEADRSRLPEIASNRAELFFGRKPAGDDLVILGDTPADVRCGESIGARAIGVATGSYSRADLERAGAFAVVDDFSNAAEVIDAVFV